MSDRILLFIPVYRCEKQISRMLAKINSEHKDLLQEILVIDNQSPDATVECAIDAAKELQTLTGIPIKVLQNVVNVSLGGTHKVAFNYALNHGFDYVCILHGDDQGDIFDLACALESKRYRELDFYLGARFMKESTLMGYSRFRIIGNYVFNLLFSYVTNRKIYDLGSGMNIFKVSSLADRFYMTFPNRLTFNYYFMLYISAHHKRFEFFPHRWVEKDQVSNVKLFSAVKEILLLLAKYGYYGKHMFSMLPDDDHAYEIKTLYASKISD
jgi:glycosyltransferase involved in cell wall biosynthesis